MRLVCWPRRWGGGVSYKYKVGGGYVRLTLFLGGRSFPSPPGTATGIGPRTAAAGAAAGTAGAGAGTGRAAGEDEAEETRAGTTGPGPGGQGLGPDPGASRQRRRPRPTRRCGKKIRSFSTWLPFGIPGFFRFLFFARAKRLNLEGRSSQPGDEARTPDGCVCSGHQGPGPSGMAVSSQLQRRFG